MINKRASLEVSALITTRADDPHLKRILRELRVFSETIVLVQGNITLPECFFEEDFGNCRFFNVESVSIKERLIPKYYTLCSYDWIILIDPDESIVWNGIASSLSEEILSPVSNSHIGMVEAKWSFFFKKKLLTSTIWGQQRSKCFLFHKARVLVSDKIHQSITLKDAYCSVSTLSFQVRHYWSNSYRDLVSKHIRYAKYDGLTAYQSYGRAAPIRCIAIGVLYLYRNLFRFSAARDFPKGICLTLIHFIYTLLISYWAFSYATRRRIRQERRQDRGLKYPV